MFEWVQNKFTRSLLVPDKMLHIACLWQTRWASQAEEKEAEEGEEVRMQVKVQQRRKEQGCKRIDTLQFMHNVC